jgi:hypothetical protein
MSREALLQARRVLRLRVLLLIRLSSRVLWSNKSLAFAREAPHAASIICGRMLTLPVRSRR